ncbi:MAG: Maf family nucleotide pyrophosphatase [Proteobacteria bacterium]|nr:Maf family nucleotide pyrophosphatase [Pseudomonadota bacterium]MDA1132180.1 Maf family nucleotide pyrophosphatase [Pseudomonadota bacterium]
MSPATGRRLLLASASARRLALLRQIGVEPDRVVAPDVDETLRRAESARDAARRLAVAKRDCDAVAADGVFVLAVDTVVACGRRILPKTGDEAVARRHMALLSGRRHRVTTAVAVRSPGGICRERVVTTVVTVKRMTSSEIDWVLAGGEWRGCAGGYAIQGRFAALVKNINGSYSNIVGLPLSETAALLDGLGYPVARAG